MKPCKAFYDVEYVKYLIRQKYGTLKIAAEKLEIQESTLTRNLDEGSEAFEIRLLNIGIDVNGKLAQTYRTDSNTYYRDIYRLLEEINSKQDAILKLLKKGEF